MKKNTLALVLSFFLVSALLAQETVTYDLIASKVGDVFNVRQGTYWITSVHSNRSLDVKGAINNNGIVLHLWDIHKGDAQQFVIEPSNERGFVYIKTIWGRALDISGANPNAGADLITWDFHGNDNQKWQFLEAGRGTFTIRSKYGTFIGSQNGGSDAGTVMKMFGTDYKNAQKWTLRRFK